MTSDIVNCHIYTELDIMYEPEIDETEIKDNQCCICYEEYEKNMIFDIHENSKHNDFVCLQCYKSLNEIR
jgi:hypothetical protein